jgi:hypothetical protein
VKHLSWIGLVLALLLAACGRPDGAAKAPAAANAPTVERTGPVKWNAASGAFELNGKPLKTIKLWTFDGSTDGFTVVRSKVVPAADSGIAVTIADPTIRSPKGLNVPGGQYPLVLVRLTRTAPGELWDGALYYATPSHDEQAGYFGKPIFGSKPRVGETTTLVYDMSHQARGGPDWTQSTIDEIRLDIEDKAGGGFLIRQVAIAENPDPAAFGPPPTATAPTAPAGPPTAPAAATPKS